MHLEGPKVFVAIALAVFNLAVAFIVAAAKLPIYLDSIGIVVSTIILGLPYGVLCALITVAAGSLLVNPYLWAYTITALAIAVVTELLYRAGMFRNVVLAAISGLIISVFTALLSAPVNVALGGNTFSGSDAITAFMMASGKSLLQSVFVSNFTAEPVDKVLVAVLSFLAIRGIPQRVATAYGFRRLQPR
ncbi:MAG TPA: hypothetical protein VHT53_12745 [Candidatus Elarobacter sp.]|jgi:energy-coupling factor transport system substrate-specific component|nr:hypothetical protein [Candidatus Elarobacter sp.]